MSFNIFIQMELNFHKINSVFSSIDQLIVMDNQFIFFINWSVDNQSLLLHITATAQHYRAQVC
jgi:hypothetical protein